MPSFLKNIFLMKFHSERFNSTFHAVKNFETLT
jgi:hypothetical protein